MPRSSPKKLFFVCLTVLALAFPGVASADDDGGVVNALCTQLLDAVGIDTDRSNICPLTQGQGDDP